MDQKTPISRIKKSLFKGSKTFLFKDLKGPFSRIKKVFLKDQKVPSQGSKKSLFHVSSTVKWLYQDNFKPVFFLFFMKRFRVHKNTHKQKLTNKTKLSKHWTTKAPIFHAHKLESHLFYFLELFLHAESLHKKNR